MPKQYTFSNEPMRPPAAMLVRSTSLLLESSVASLNAGLAAPKMPLGSERAVAPPPRIHTLPEASDQLEAKLYDAKAQAKQIAAALAMHLSSRWRARIFGQLDDLLDYEEWADGDQILDRESMRTFLRFVIYAGWAVIPSLGISNTGNLLASWHTDARKMTIEFYPQDHCRLVVADKVEEDRSILTFVGPLSKARGFAAAVGFGLGQAS